MGCISFKLNGLPCHVSMGGPIRLLTIYGKSFRFEDHSYFGPVAVKKNGDTKKDPGPHSPFWPAHRSWESQGKKVDGEGNCIFTMPDHKMPRFVRLLGNQCLAIPDNATTEEIEAKVRRFCKNMPASVSEAILASRPWEKPDE